MRSWFFLLFASLASLFTSGCVKMPSEPPLPMTATVLPVALEKLPSPPPSLSEDEQASSWGQEYRLGQQFAKEGDYYRAATCFHRSRFLLPPSSLHKSQIIHALLLTYAIGGRYQEETELWEREQGSFQITDSNLARDCICLLFEAYSRLNKTSTADHLLTVLPQDDALRQRLPMFQTISSNEEPRFTDAARLAASVSPEAHKEADDLSSLYMNSRKDPSTARVLNALLPGSGYLYVRQYQTAAASFVLNALFIASSLQLAAAHQGAAAVISGGFEVGWYLGGITGAGLAAEMYNQRLREQLWKPYLERHNLFPLHQLHYQW